MQTIHYDRHGNVVVQRRSKVARGGFTMAHAQGLIVVLFVVGILCVLGGM